MPRVTFSDNTFASGQQIQAVIEGVIGVGRTMAFAYGAGLLQYVDLPDATQVEADAVRAALLSNFPYETAGKAEPHMLLSLMPGAAALAWNAQPAAITEFLGLSIHRSGGSLFKVEQVRLVVNVITPGASGALLGAQWSAGGPFAFFDTVGQGPQVSIATAGFQRSAWVNTPAAARADAAIRIVGALGNGVANPAFGAILVEGR